MKRLPLLTLFLPLVGLVSCNQTGTPEVSQIELNRTQKNLVVGETFQLEIAKITGGPKTVNYWSSDEAVAAVSSSGLVTAKGKGEAKILAICDSQKAVCLVSVSEKETEKSVDLRPGLFQADFASPYFEIDGTFLCPTQMYSETVNGTPNADLLFELGKGEGEQPKKNISILAKLAEKMDETTLSSAYSGLLSDSSADLSKEQGHLGIYDKEPHLAFTTKEGEGESPRLYKKPTFSFSKAVTLFQLIGLPSFSPSTLLEFDWKGAFDTIATEEGYPDEKTRPDVEKYGTLVGDFISAIAGGFTLKKTVTESEDRFSITLIESGLDGFSAYVAKHQDDLNFKAVFTYTKAELSFVYPKDKNTLTGINLVCDFKASGQSNSITCSLKLEESQQAGEKDYFTKLEQNRQSW